VVALASRMGRRSTQGSFFSSDVTQTTEIMSAIGQQRCRKEDRLKPPLPKA